MFCLATKLHILLVLVVVLIALYLIYIYREIKVFEREIASIKHEVLLLKDITCEKKSDIPSRLPQVSPTPVVSPVIAETHKVSTDIPQIAPGDDDSSSVSSAELKNILDNIEEEDSGSEDTVKAEAVADVKAEADADVKAEAVVQQPETLVGECKEDIILTSIGRTSDEDLQTMKYDELRSLLKQHGVNAKGTKPELIQRIKALHSH